MLRPALELAWGVAKVGAQARPAVAVPGRLRPLMGFAKLSARALTTVRQVVEDDADFRARVAEWAVEGTLDRAPFLWLVRPDGWEEELRVLVDAAAVEATEKEEEKEERRARRRLDGVELALARAETELVRLRQVNADLADEAAAERQARRQAEAEYATLESERRQAEEDRTRLDRTVASLQHQVASLAQDLAETAERLSESNDELDTARTRAEVLGGQLEAAGTETARLDAGRDEIRSAVSGGVAKAAAAAQQLSQALAEVAASVAGPDVEAAPSSSSEAAAAGAHPPPAARSGTRAARPSPPRRRPVPLPPAVFDDTFEAADHLVRVTGILLIVDGYNVTISSWPHLELPRQRHRLVDALAELAMRAGPSVHVVFDGAEAGGRFGAPAAARRRMRVTFSPEGVDADEVIVNMVEELDPSQPVVVATDDREVRDAVRRRGGNVISVAQLLGVLGRAPGSAAG